MANPNTIRTTARRRGIVARSALMALSALALFAAILAYDQGLNTPRADAQTTPRPLNVMLTPVGCGGVRASWQLDGIPRGGAANTAGKYTLAWTVTRADGTTSTGSHETSDGTTSSYTISGGQAAARISVTVADDLEFVTSYSILSRVQTANGTMGIDCPTGSVTFPSVALFRLTARWPRYFGSSGDTVIRVNPGATALTLGAGNQPCSDADKAANPSLVCTSVTGSTRNANITGLEHSTQYHVGVWRAVEDTWRLIAQGTGRTSAPAAPTITVTPGAGCGTATVRWDAITGATGYTVTWTGAGGLSGSSGMLARVLSYEITEPSLTGGENITVSVAVNGGPSDGLSSGLVGSVGDRCATVSAITFTGVTHYSFWTSWTAHPSGTGSSYVRISAGSTGAAVPSGGAPCDSTDRAQAAVVVCTQPSSGRTDRNNIGLTPDTQYHMGVWQQVSGTWTLIAEGAQRTGTAPGPGLAFFDGVSNSEFRVALDFPGYPGSSGSYRVRLTQGSSAAAIPSGSDPCDATDAAQATVTCATKGASDTTHTFTGLTANATYHVGVWRKVGTVWMLIIEGTQQAVDQPTALYVNTRNGSRCGDLGMSWNSITGATGYTVSWTASPSGRSGTLSDTSVSWFRNATDLPAGETITISVRVDGGPSDGVTTTATGTTGRNCPQEATVTLTTGSGCGDLVVGWNHFPDATGYTIFYTVDGLETPRTITGRSTTTYTLTVLGDGASVDVNVRVNGGVNDGRRSPTVSGTAGNVCVGTAELAPAPNPNPGGATGGILLPPSGSGSSGGAPPASNQESEPEPEPDDPTAPVPLAEIQLRDNLIAAQETLLNVYRCMFDIDVEVVPDGCIDGAPARGPSQPGEIAPNPTQADRALRDELVFAQEELLNIYRCMFDIDVEVVPGGCIDGAPADPDRLGA